MAQQGAQLDASDLAKLSSGGGMDVEQIQKKQAEQKRQEEMREEMLVQIMTPDARERCSRIAMVKPEKARRVEDVVIQMARVGQIRGKVDEQQLIRILEQVGGPTEEKKSAKIVFNRRRYEDDEDDGLFDDDI